MLKVKANEMIEEMESVMKKAIGYLIYLIWQI